MSLFFTPTDGVSGDVIPFFWNDRYHLFYLKDYRDPAGHGEVTPWFHLSTTDFVTYEDHGEAIPRGAVDEQDLFIFTGCVIEHDGLFHIFYTGHNHHLREAGKPQEAIMHATSPDLMTWTKDPANPILFADPARYEVDDWRDPFVFWNEEAGEWWMLLAARGLEGPSHRRGCVALATSPDLVSWTIREPFWAPGLYFTHECPDLFRIGDVWYLVYSTFSERHVTHYRQASALAGPWSAPDDDQFDTRAYYAAKTASDGVQRFLFGWTATREDDSDDGRWQWGGSIVVHEVTQQADGALTVSIPATVSAAAFEGAESFPDVTLDPGDGFAWQAVGPCGPASTFGAEILIAPGTRDVSLHLKASPTLDASHLLRIEPRRGRAVFDRWPRPGDQPFIQERMFAVPEDRPISLVVVREGSDVEAYIDGTLVLSCRAYGDQEGDWALAVSEGAATFHEIRIANR
ncbi:MAG: family 43 glycosylhydrolase [Thermomicrobiales bacterium]